MTTTFENAKVGDRVYSLLDGWTEIESICTGMDAPYPIMVKKRITESQYLRMFTVSGKVNDGGDQVLFWDKPTIIAPEQPKPKREAPPVDTLVEYEFIGNWSPAYSSGRVDNDMLRIYEGGRTSKTSANRNNRYAYVSRWRIAEDNCGWIEHIPTADSVCPVPECQKVTVKYRCGKIGTSYSAGYFRWDDRGNEMDIIAYKVAT